MPALSLKLVGIAVLPGHVELPGRAIDGDARQFLRVAHRNAEFQVDRVTLANDATARVDACPVFALVRRAQDRLLECDGTRGLESNRMR